MDQVKTLQLVAQARREMPRNATVLALCEELERAASQVEVRVVKQPVAALDDDSLRRAYNQYMRERMKRWRAKKR